MMCMMFGVMYFLMVAQSASCHTLSNAFLKSVYKDSITVVGIDLIRQGHYQSVLSFSRVLVFLTGLLGVICLVLIVSLAYVLPIKEKYPVFVEFEGASSNYVVLKSGIGSSKNVLIAAALTKYLLDRETIDIYTKENRFASVRALHLAGSEVDQQFTALVASANYGVLERNARRLVTVLSENQIYVDNVAKYRISVQDISLLGGKIQNREEDIITLSYQFSDLKISAQDAEKNPLGIIVSGYSRVKNE